MQEPAQKAMTRLVGAELAAVTFVRDYIQLDFDGSTINAMIPISVIAEGRTVRSGDERFRNALCGQIGRSVTGVEVRAGEAITIDFAGGLRISLSLRAEDYTGPEAVVLHDVDGQIIVF